MKKILAMMLCLIVIGSSFGFLRNSDGSVKGIDEISEPIVGFMNTVSNAGQKIVNSFVDLADGNEIMSSENALYAPFCVNLTDRFSYYFYRPSFYLYSIDIKIDGNYHTCYCLKLTCFVDVNKPADRVAYLVVKDVGIDSEGIASGELDGWFFVFSLGWLSTLKKWTLDGVTFPMRAYQNFGSTNISLFDLTDYYIPS